MTCRVELREGSGRVLVNIIPYIGIDLQTTSKTAVSVAENFTGARLGKTDAIITIEAEESVEVVDGPGAGAAIYIATMAAINGHALNETVFITGTINHMDPWTLWWHCRKSRGSRIKRWDNFPCS